MLWFVKNILLLLLVYIALPGCRTTMAPGDPVPETGNPNVLIILADDLGWNDLGYSGNGYHQTPNIDQLVSEGLNVTRAYANAPNCAPTRASLLTGMYTPRHGIYTVGNPARGRSRHRQLIPEPNETVLSTEFYTLAEAFRDEGYRTGFFGKWHLGKSAETLPAGQGFDVNVGGNERGYPPSYFSPYQNPYLADGPEGEYLTDRLSAEASAYLAESSDAPFFVLLSFYAVHTPLQGKPEKVDKYTALTSPHERSDPRYAALVESLDEGVGRVLEALRMAGKANDTIVVFLSDNGPYYSVTSAAPLRGSKGMLYEGGTRIPMAVRWPGHINPGTSDSTRVLTSDLYPTLLSMIGAVNRNMAGLDGVDLSPSWLYQRTIADRPLFWHFPAYLEAYGGMTERWRQTPAGAVIWQDWKLIESFETGDVELYNLRSDPGELLNVASEYPVVVEDLRQRMREWRSQANAPVPVHRNPEYVPDNLRGNR